MYVNVTQKHRTLYYGTCAVYVTIKGIRNSRSDQRQRDASSANFCFSYSTLMYLLREIRIWKRKRLVQPEKIEPLFFGSWWTGQQGQQSGDVEGLVFTVFGFLLFGKPTVCGDSHFHHRSSIRVFIQYKLARKGLLQRCQSKATGARFHRKLSQILKLLDFARLEAAYCW